MAIQRVKACALCTTQFTTSQIKAKYCPECRTKAKKGKQVDRRQKVAERRILSLPQSDEWLWVARECRRAGTVEILQDVNIEALFAVYRARFKCYGWNPDTKQSKFHLCHIFPVKDKNSIGLLSHLNLFIGNSLPNQVYSNKSHDSKGLKIPVNQLKRKWLIDKDSTDRNILDKVAKYLGPILVEYAKKNPVRKSQRFSLARWVYQNDPDNIMQLQQIERLSMQQLRTIRAYVEGKEVYKMDFTAKRSVVVAFEECQRLSVQLPECQHRSDVAFMVPVLQVAAAWLSRLPEQQGLHDILERPYGVTWEPLKLREGMDVSVLRDFISFQAFAALQGETLDRKMVLNTLRKYLVVTTLTPDYSKANDSIRKYFAEQYSRFVAQVPVIKAAILSLGLADKIIVAEDLQLAAEAAREEAIFESFGYEQCEGLHDYSTIHYEVEEDYVPNPNNPNLRRFIEPIFVDF